MVFSSDSTLNLGSGSSRNTLLVEYFSSSFYTGFTTHNALSIFGCPHQEINQLSVYSCSLCYNEKAECNHHTAACKLTGVFSNTRSHLCTWLKMSMPEWGTIFNTKIWIKPKVKKETKPLYREKFQDLAAKQWLKPMWTYFMSFFLSHNN